MTENNSLFYIQNIFEFNMIIEKYKIQVYKLSILIIF